MSKKESLTATNLAVYQHLNCDLYIHNVYHGAVLSGTSSPTTGSTSPSELAKAQYKRGLDWESSLYSWLDESNLLLKVPPFPSDGETLLENILADERKHFFVTSFAFWPPQEKLQLKFLDAGTSPLRFGLAKPDLLEIKRTDQGIEWRVIDAKASRNVKSSHHIQIYFYTLCLNHILQTPNFRGQDIAGIWLPPKDGFHDNPPSIEDIKSISMSLLSPPLDALIFRILPKVISQPREAVKWHFNPLCHGCKYEPDCKKRTLDDGEIGNIPNVSIDDARALKELLRMSHVATQTQPNSNRLTDIEDLHNIIADRAKFGRLARTSPSVVRKANQVLVLPKKTRYNFESVQSPVVEAARSKKIQVIPRRNHTCPRQEDIAVFISIVKDPSSASLGGDHFHVVSYSPKSAIRIPSPVIAKGDDFLPKLAKLVRAIESSGHTSQFYVWSYPEQALLQTYIINAALTSSASDSDVRLCIGALSQGASLLQTTFQPLLLSGALMAFLGKGRKLKLEYQKCLGRLGLSTEGTVDTLKKRLEAKLKELQQEAAMTGDAHREDRRKEFGQLPRVVVLKKEVERQLALPIPGYWDLSDCYAELLGESDRSCPDDEQIFSAFRNDQDISVDDLLARRNACLYAVLKDLRRRAVSAAGHSLFVNNAKRISTTFMDFCKQGEIRKLFFMQQFEVLAKLTELWQSRIDGCPEAPTLEYVGPKSGRQGTEHVFRVVSGTVDVPSSDKDRAFHDKLLVVDTPDSLTDEDATDVLPVEALFDDLGVSGLVFPLNRWTKANWLRQDPRVQQELVVADIKNVYTDPEGFGTKVALRSWGTNTPSFIPGTIYRLSPRLVDFNTTKILSALFELDLDWEYSLDEMEERDQRAFPHAFNPFVQLMLDPNSLGKANQSETFVKAENEIQTLFGRLRQLDNAVAGSLILKSSQHQATKRILTNRLSVIWGPPGTGKTYTISLSLLRLIEVERRHYGPHQKIIFVTAITHAAIEACRSKLVRLMDAYKSIEHLPNEWLSKVEVDVISNGNDHPGPRKTGDTVHIYMGTIYQLYNFSKKNSLAVDCLVVDEAGQISLGSISLVLRSLAHEGRIVIAGDSEQLAPILSAQYPLLKAHALFGSVLDCLMFPRALRLAAQHSAPSFDESQGLEPTSTPGTIVQLTENFRLNPDLGEFVSTIYSRKFKPQKTQAHQLATALSKVTRLRSQDLGLDADIFGKVQRFLNALSDVMKDKKSDGKSILIAPEVQSLISTKPSPSDTEVHRPISLALIRLRTFPFNISYESHVQAEAAVAAALVVSLRKCAPDDDIFVATPHRIQREAVKTALRKIKDKNESLEDAFGQLQVSEDDMDNADGQQKVTIDTIERLQGSEASFVICLFSVPKSYAVDLAFLLERRRLNVAISRAKTLCILVSSEEVLCPSVKILANEDTAKGYAFLKAFQKRAWSFYLQLNADKINV